MVVRRRASAVSNHEAGCGRHRKSTSSGRAHPWQGIPCGLRKKSLFWVGTNCQIRIASPGDLMLRISRDLSIDEDDIDIAFIRASGPGGQNVNKVATSAQLRF